MCAGGGLGAGGQACTGRGAATTNVVVADDARLCSLATAVSSWSRPSPPVGWCSTQRRSSTRRRVLPRERYWNSGRAEKWPISCSGLHPSVRSASALHCARAGQRSRSTPGHQPGSRHRADARLDALAPGFTAARGLTTLLCPTAARWPHDRSAGHRVALTGPNPEAHPAPASGHRRRPPCPSPWSRPGSRPGAVCSRVTAESTWPTRRPGRRRAPARDSKSGERSRAESRLGPVIGSPGEQGPAMGGAETADRLRHAGPRRPGWHELSRYSRHLADFNNICL
jgi:hypothetical protein